MTKINNFIYLYIWIVLSVLYLNIKAIFFIKLSEIFNCFRSYFPFKKEKSWKFHFKSLDFGQFIYNYWFWSSKMFLNDFVRKFKFSVSAFKSQLTLTPLKLSLTLMTWAILKKTLNLPVNLKKCIARNFKRWMTAYLN